jgi:PAS domain S-box-containing protein
MADLDGNITYVNPTLFRWSDEKTPEDCIGKPLSAYMPADYRGRRESEILPAIRQKGFWQGEEPVHLRDGRTVYTLFSVFPVQDETGKLLRTAVVITDITELKHAERALRKSEAQYRALVESCPDPVVMIDLQGKTVFASQRAVEQHRVVDADALIGRSAAEFVAESDRDKYRESIGRLIEDGVHRNVEYTFLRDDGSKFEAEVSSSVIWDAAGRPEAMMAVYRDISDRKRAEEALREEQESLRRLLQASDRERELITYDIHDGVAQQLLGALLHLEAVSKRESDLAEDVKGQFDAGLGALRRASAEARSLMNRMRTPVLQRFGIRPAIADFIDQFTDRPDAPEIIYRCEADFGRLEPVLENTIFRVAQEAITNACVHSNADLVRVSLTQQNEEVTMEVQDDGIGFDVAEKKNRFGLHGIRERVRLLGKALAIESEPGRGTCIRATFPLIFREEEENGN